MSKSKIMIKKSCLLEGFRGLKHEIMTWGNSLPSGRVSTLRPACGTTPVLRSGSATEDGEDGLG